jgi:cytochrome c556
MDHVAKEPEEFREILRDSETAAGELETAIVKWNEMGRPSPTPDSIAVSFTRVSKACMACHQQYRDVPLSEKQR